MSSIGWTTVEQFSSFLVDTSYSIAVVVEVLVEYNCVATAAPLTDPQPQSFFFDREPGLKMDKKVTSDSNQCFHGTQVTIVAVLSSILPVLVRYTHHIIMLIERQRSPW